MQKSTCSDLTEYASIYRLKQGTPKEKEKKKTSGEGFNSPMSAENTEFIN